MDQRQAMPELEPCVRCGYPHINATWLCPKCLCDDIEVTKKAVTEILVDAYDEHISDESQDWGIFSSAKCSKCGYTSGNEAEWLNTAIRTCEVCGKDVPKKQGYEAPDGTFACNECGGEEVFT